MIVTHVATEVPKSHVSVELDCIDGVYLNVCILDCNICAVCPENNSGKEHVPLSRQRLRVA